MENGETRNVYLPRPILDGFWGLLTLHCIDNPPEGGASLTFQYDGKELWIPIVDPEEFFSDNTPLFAIIKLGVSWKGESWPGITITFEKAEEEDEEVEVEVQVICGAITLTREMVLPQSVLDRPRDGLLRYIHAFFEEDGDGPIETYIEWSDHLAVLVDGRRL